jgi:hypothetical protein
MAIDPHAQIEGPPNGLLVLSGGWTTKNRPIFGSGDDAGWKRKTDQLRRGQLREINTHAISLGASGGSRGGLGEFHVGAILRDQFVAGNREPLPPEHPACLYAYATVPLSTRTAGWAEVKSLTALARQAVQHFDATDAFLEPERPDGPHPYFAKAPTSATTWTYHRD